MFKCVKCAKFRLIYLVIFSAQNVGLHECFRKSPGGMRISLCNQIPRTASKISRLHLESHTWYFFVTYTVNSLSSFSPCI